MFGKGEIFRIDEGLGREIIVGVLMGVIFWGG